MTKIQTKIFKQIFDPETSQVDSVTFLSYFKSIYMGIELLTVGNGINFSLLYAHSPSNRFQVLLIVGKDFDSPLLMGNTVNWESRTKL